MAVKKPIAQKLFIKEHHRVLLINEPENYRALLGVLPADVSLLTEVTAPVDLIQVFVTSKKELETQLKDVTVHLKPNGLLWVTYPKKTAKIQSDINRDSIREYASTLNLKAVAMVAIDDTWSALRLKVET
jgi:predicted CoA-binding protein